MKRLTKAQGFLTLLMPYDLYERHAVVGHFLLDALADVPADIGVLDVGGRSGLLERFIPYEVISVNIDGSGDLWGDGCVLPLVDRSFSAVVSIDALEHLPKERRLPFLQECLRVARRCAIFAAPFGSQGHAAYEKRLNELHRSARGRSHAYLSEHIRYGLPDLAEINRLVRKSGAAESRLSFAGDYVRQGKLFEQAVLGQKDGGVLSSVRSLYQYIAALALFHPVQLQDRPGARSNRFYLALHKKPTVVKNHG